MANGEIRLRQDVQIKTVGEESLLYDQGLQKVHVINKSAAAVWSLLKEGSNIEDVVKHFADQYKVEEQQVREDVKMIVDQFKQSGLFCE